MGPEHDSAAQYSYVEANLLIHPDDYKGIGLRGSYEIRPHVALMGRYDRLGADVANADVTSTLISVGGRYFSGIVGFDNTDVDLSARLTRAEAKASGLAFSDTGFVLGGQLRHMLGNKAIGGSVLTAEEVFAGVSIGFSDGDTSVVALAGVVVAINDQFSAKAEIALDDGTRFSLGVRMALGKKQINPEPPAKAALILAPAPAVVPEPVMLPELVIVPGPAFVPTPQPMEPPQVRAAASPYGLSADELAEFEGIAGKS